VRILDKVTRNFATRSQILRGLFAGLHSARSHKSVGDNPLDTLISDGATEEDTRLEVTVHDISPDVPWLPTPLGPSDQPEGDGRRPSLRSKSSSHSSRAESRRHSLEEKEAGVEPAGTSALLDPVSKSGAEHEREGSANSGAEAKRPPALIVPPGESFSNGKSDTGRSEDARGTKSFSEVPKPRGPSKGFQSMPTSPRAALSRSLSTAESPGSSTVSSQKTPRGKQEVPGGRLPGTRSAGNSVESLHKAHRDNGHRELGPKSPGSASRALSRSSSAAGSSRQSWNSGTAIAKAVRNIDFGEAKSSREGSESGDWSASSTPPGSPRKRLKSPWRPPSFPGGSGRLHLKPTNPEAQLLDKAE
jgi:hypothetical protein